MFGENAEPDLKVTTTRSGSFEIDLVLQMGFVASNLLTSPLVVSALNLRQVTVMAIGLIKRLQAPHGGSSDQPDREVAEAIDHVGVRLGDFELKVDGSAATVETVAREALQLVRDPQVLRATRRLVGPVQREGIDRMLIKENSRELESVAKDEARLFEPNPIDGDVRDVGIPSQLLKVISPHLGEGNRRWRLHDCNKTNWYLIRDEEFIDEVRQRSRRFASGDILECEVRIIQQITVEGRVTADLEVLRVLSHVSPPDSPPQLGFSDL